MKLVFATTAIVTAGVAFTVGTATGRDAPHWTAGAKSLATVPMRTAKSVKRSAPKDPRAITNAFNGVVQNYCTDCHSDQTLSGNLSLEHFDLDSVMIDDRREESEKLIRELRAHMMPIPGAPVPANDSLDLLVSLMEQRIDKASTKANPGTRTFQRLNRSEYDAVIRDLLGLEFDSGEYLPLDTKSANFDNIADVQMLSPTLLESYLNASSAVTRAAVGDRKATSQLISYYASPFTSQHPWDHIEGTPYGTRGGIVAENIFPADGLYSFRINVSGGVGTKLEDLDISVDGNQVALLHYEKGTDQNLASADAPAGADYVKSDPIQLKAGQHHVSVAFVRRGDGPYEDLIMPHGWSKASNGNGSDGTTEPPHVMELGIVGPVKTTGMSETPSRKIIFTCHPTAAVAQRACAEQIINNLGSKAYRRPLTQHDRDGLIKFYDKAVAKDGFEEAVRVSLQAMLASPYFVFRFEAPPANVAPGQVYAINDYDLATRLSFFLWGSIPDDELLLMAKEHKLSDKKTLDVEVNRMLADPRSQVLSTRFVYQWLRLSDIDKVRPDAFYFPDYNQQLADAMKTETELFFNDIVRNNHSVLDLYTADYTFVNERLAKHYGIPNVSGDEFRKVTYPDDTRRGLLGQGSVLVQTSFANRTSPTVRGKYVMEVLIGKAPPPPPPNVPGLDETSGGKEGRPLTTRERMEIHRKNPTCRTCHQYMDPIGLALDNFDVTGKWRYRENGTGLDTQGQMYDGTPISKPSDLTNALIKRPIPLVRTFTENLMAYALGRRVEDYDEPTVRAIVRDAEANGYRVSSFVVGVVNSSAFRSKRADPVVSADKDKDRH
ncbi:MAG: DUF1592 domain-containing protein [Gemmatimonadaceae bacterium]